MTIRLATSLFAAALLLTLASSSVAQEMAEAPVPRSVLVLYNSLDNLSDDDNPFRENFQMPANYLGLNAEFLDAAQRPLPGPEEMERFLGVVTCFFGDVLPRPDEFLSWLLDQFRQGRKVLIIDSLGASVDPDGKPANQALRDKVLEKLGVSYVGNETITRPRIRQVFVDPDLYAFERSLPPHPASYVQYRMTDASVRPLVLLERTDIADSASPVVFVSGTGGMGPVEYLYWQAPATFNRQWHIDPFSFLSLAFGLESFPAPTPTTLNGCRVAFSHVDGDAFNGYSEIERGTSCGEVVMEHIFKAYDLPFTASVIVAEIDPSLYGNPEMVNLAREMYLLDNVEPASHTYSHPFYWNPVKRKLKEAERDLHGYEILGYDFDPAREIIGSCDYITRELSPAGKDCKVLLWSGDCEPTAEQIALADEARILSMNGGDSVLVEGDNSLANIAPLYRFLHGSHQIFTGQANENILTNLWQGPYHGYRNIIATMEATESPRRLSPINPYYHFYSGERIASLKALTDVYDWLMAQEASHVFASDYIRMARGFISARFATLEDGGLVISDYGDCVSIRFPADGPEPDLQACENVYGFLRIPQGLFVHLAPGAERAVIRLREGDTSEPQPPHLSKATGWIRDLAISEQGASFSYAGFATGRIVLSAMAPDTPYAVALADGRVLDLVSSPEGTLVIEDPANGAIEVSRQ